jgi:hypothetical protein
MLRASRCVAILGIRYWIGVEISRKLEATLVLRSSFALHLSRFSGQRVPGASEMRIDGSQDLRSR